MAHEVEKMVFAGSTPWHGLGTQIDEATGFWDAFNQAGLNWEVETEPLYRENGEKVKAQASVRQSDGRVLGVVGPRWTPLQNKHAFEVFEPMVDSGDLILHTAGSHAPHLPALQRIGAAAKVRECPTTAIRKSCKPQGQGDDAARQPIFLVFFFICESDLYRKPDVRV